MTGYYSQNLSAERLRRCYEIAPPRVRQYLQAEIRHVASRLRPSDTVLELGCGYGRVIRQLAGHARRLVGIDTSRPSLRLAQDLLSDVPNCALAQMDASRLAFRNRAFDTVVCIQNGISAFRVDPRALIHESIRVTRPGGMLLLSSYSAGFWSSRLRWFELQARYGLVGEIDAAATGDGVITCKDGFKATTFSADDFRSLLGEFGLLCRLEEVDESSLLCEVAV